MNCKNDDKFPISPIMFDKTYVKDTDGNILFKLNNYIYQKQFACEVGILDSKKDNKIELEPPSTISSTTPSKTIPSTTVSSRYCC